MWWCHNSTFNKNKKGRVQESSTWVITQHKSNVKNDSNIIIICIGGQPCTCTCFTIINNESKVLVVCVFLLSVLYHFLLLWCDWVCLFMQCNPKQNNVGPIVNCYMVGTSYNMQLCSKLSGWTILSLHNVVNSHWLKGNNKSGRDCVLNNHVLKAQDETPNRASMMESSMHI